jgi:hypothetical protein
MKKATILISVILMCLSLTGCAALQNLFKRPQPVPPLDYTKVAQPTLEQITSAVNRNSQAIRNFTTENASIHMPGPIIMPLSSRLTFERPKRLRIQGSMSSIGGQEFDFGSNDILFWLWIRREKEMWYCRHDLYPMCPMRATIPIDPDWLIEALGIVEFKPTDQHLGPTRLEDGNWEIVSHCQTPSGQYLKRTVLDSKIGLVLRQELYTPQNTLIALAETKNVKYDPIAGVHYVKRVEVQCQGMDGKMTIDLGTPTFNTSASFAAKTFDMPTFEGYRAVDLCSPAFLQPHGTVMPTYVPNAAGYAVPEAHTQTVIR